MSWWNDNPNIDATVQDGWRIHWPKEHYPNAYKFFFTLECVLNTAIDCCAAALNWVIDKVPSYSCKDITSVFDLINKVGAKATLFNVAPAAYVHAMSLLGFWATIYAAPVSLGKKVISLPLKN